MTELDGYKLRILEAIDAIETDIRFRRGLSEGQFQQLVLRGLLVLIEQVEIKRTGYIKDHDSMGENDGAS